jgi:cytochrome c oxidase assembly protein subunit 15
MSGGLVAGLDAGLIYNEFPYMGTGFHPPKSELFDEFYSHREDKSDLWWRNMLENPSTVQLNPRILAMTTFTAVLGLWAYSRFSPRIRAKLPHNARKGMLGVVHLVLLQATLGISTLIYLVPTPLAAAHQAGSLALLTGVMVLGNRVWFNRAAVKLVKGKGKGKHLHLESVSASARERAAKQAQLQGKKGKVKQPVPADLKKGQQAKKGQPGKKT